MKKRNDIFEYQAGGILPFGVSQVSTGVQFTVYLPNKKNCFLRLYRKGKKEPAMEIALTDKYKIGSVYFVILRKKKTSKDSRSIAEILNQDYEYMYEADGEEFIDPYASVITGREKWGKEEQIQRGGICLKDFDWEEDTPLHIPYDDLILYQLHVRGYTKHSSSKVQHKGTYQGLIEKIPYMKDLGINAVLLFPVYEFQECIKREYQLPVSKDGKETEESKLNYWGYGTKNTFYFAPKASYSSDRKSPSAEFKRMVKEFHRAGIEVLLDIYFLPGTNLFLMTDCLRNWVVNYHIDGFRVNQEVMPSLALASDPILSCAKILGNYWDCSMLKEANISGRKNTLADYNEGFMNEMRRFLKSDEGMVERAVYYLSRNDTQHSFINFMTHVNGFTMMDLVSYDIKHNEANGERNQDGTEVNYSWNCGVEGKTRKKAVMERRMIQIRNAFLMLLSAQGAPMIFAGDELGNTQFGNNNAYCQDNPTTWINWNQTKVSTSIHTFVKNMIAFRKSHKVLHQKEPLQMHDYLSYGIPDLSIHGMQAWKPDFSYYSRMLGMLYYGEYVKEEGKATPSLYIIYNMFWEPKSFDLPNLPDGKTWQIVIDTYDNTFHDADTLRVYSKEKKKRKGKEMQRKTVVSPRSIVVFESR